MRLNRGRGLALALVLCGAHPAWADDVDWAADQQAIIDLLSDGPLGIENDFESWAAEFHPDWTIWFAGRAEVRAKGPHMQAVRDYIDGGARVTGFEAEFIDITVTGDTAVARFNATESLQEADGSARTSRFASMDYLIREDGVWTIRATTLTFLPDDTP